jgi:O-antigen/teichoic acid export membrane protein
MNLLSQFTAYAVGRALAAVLAFAQLLLVVRGLGIAQYGHLAETYAIAALLSALLFQWVAKASLRFAVPETSPSFAAFSSVIVAALGASTLLLVVSFVAFMSLSDRTSKHALVIILVALAVGVKEIASELLRGQQQARMYSVLFVSDAALTLLLTMLAISVKAGWEIIAVSSASSSLIVYAYVLWLLFNRATLVHLDSKEVTRFLRYGYPLSAASLLGVFVSSGVRLVIGAELGIKALGLFAAIYDLMQRTTVVALSVMNSALHPAIFAAWSRRDIVGAKRLAAQNLTAICVIGSLAASLFVMWIDLIAKHVLRVETSQQPVMLTLVWLSAFAIVAYRIRTFHLDLPFLLTKKTLPATISSAVTVIVFFLIIDLHLGRGDMITIAGALLISYVAGGISSLILGRGLHGFLFDRRTLPVALLGSLATVIIGFAADQLSVGTRIFATVGCVLLGALTAISILVLTKAPGLSTRDART